MTVRLPLFVFGTLRSGQCNHHYLSGRYTQRLQARLYGYARVALFKYPMIDVREDGCVTGELFFLTEDIYEQVMVEIDELEMLPPGEMIGEWYERKVVTVSTSEGEFQAWAYVKPRG
jgi:gamma-glutamylcyclotransferase (GGCT)/AIG2-like uncharacterized protein YtfP